MVEEIEDRKQKLKVWNFRGGRLCARQKHCVVNHIEKLENTLLVISSCIHLEALMLFTRALYGRIIDSYGKKVQYFLIMKKQQNARTLPLFFDKFLQSGLKYKQKTGSSTKRYSCYLNWFYTDTKLGKHCNPLTWCANGKVKDLWAMMKL